MKKIFTFLIILFPLLGLSCPVPTPSPDNPVEDQEKKSSIVLCFDDYSPTWADIADRYSDCQFTFFFCVEINTSEREAIVKALSKAGHTLGNHTIDHVRLTDIPNKDRDEFMEKGIIALNNQLIEKGATAVEYFAFPFGAFDRDWELRLLKVFKKIRRFGTTDNKPFFYSNHIYKNSRIIASSSLDNVMHRSDDGFKSYVEDLVSSLKKSPQTVVLTTHEVNDADWGITLSRLDFFIKHAKENGILFCGM